MSLRSWSPDLLVAIALLASACGPTGEPIVVGEQGGAGYWPANSRTAVLGAIEAELSGVELDVTLTADDVPILGGPMLEPSRCTLPDGAPLDEAVAVRALLLEELQIYLCGGLPDPNHRNAMLVAEPVMTLDELLEALKGADPGLLVQLDLLPRAPEDAETLGAAVLDRWFAADRPQPWFLTTPSNDDLERFVAYGRASGRHVPASVTWPEEAPEVRLGHELRAGFGLESLRDLVPDHADGLQLYWELADRAELNALRQEGVRVGLWGLDDPGSLEAHVDWPVDLLVTAYPGDAP